MSEYEPITAELRAKLAEYEPTEGRCNMITRAVGSTGYARLVELCDAIDAIHAGLERENAELRERLAVLDNRSESMHDGMSITDELRKWGYGFCGSSYEVVNAIADRIDAEHEKAVTAAHSNGITEYGSMVAREYVKLPVDADGVPIRVGDEVEGLNGQNADATHLTIHMDGSWDVGTRGWVPHLLRHHHVPTVEDVLREMHAELDEVTALYVGEAIDSDERDRDEARIFAKYAKRLMLAGDAE